MLVLQSDLLHAIGTRVVAPLLPADLAAVPASHLNPEIVFDTTRLLLMPQLMATLSPAELGSVLGSLEHERDRILRAVDVLLTGI